MFFNTDFNLMIKYKKLIFLGLILISLASVLLNIVFTSNFINHTPLEEETLSILPYVDDKYIILATPLRRTSYPNAYHSYGSIYYNLSTSGGWYPSAVSQDYINKLENLDKLIKSKECSKLKDELIELKTTQVITFDAHCNFLDECEFNKKINKSRACLYSL